MKCINEIAPAGLHLPLTAPRPAVDPHVLCLGEQLMEGGIVYGD